MEQDITRHKQVIMEFIEDWRRDFGIPLALAIEIAELALQEGRLGLALTSYNKALHQTPKAGPKCTCRPHDLAYYGCRCK